MVNTIGHETEKMLNEVKTLNSERRTLAICLSFGRSATRRAFRYIFARFISPRSQIPAPIPHSPSPNPIVPKTLAKDAAPIPNAE